MQPKATQPESRQDGRHWPLSRKLQHFRCESALPDPLEANFSAKTIEGVLLKNVPAPFLNENGVWPQR